MTTDSPLTAAARAVSAARVDLQRIEARTAELREKSRDLGELQRAVTHAREQRAQLLEQALLDDRKANTDEADKAVSKALAALQKREDEITAVGRALATLQTQRQAAQDALDGAMGAFREARAVRVVEFLNGRIEAMGDTRLALSRRIAEARSALALIDPGKMPRDAQGWWMSQRAHYAAIFDNFQRDVSTFLNTPHGIDAAVTLGLTADLEEADKLAALQLPIQQQTDQCAAADGRLTTSMLSADQITASAPTVRLVDRDAPGMRGIA